MALGSALGRELQGLSILFLQQHVLTWWEPRAPLVIIYQQALRPVYFCCAFPDFHSDLSAPKKKEMDVTRLFKTRPPQLPFILLERKSRWDEYDHGVGADSDVTLGPSPRQIGMGLPSLSHSCCVKPQCWVQWLHSGLCLPHLLFPVAE